MNCNAELFCRILSVDWQEALLAYDLGNVSFVTVELTDPAGDVLTWKSEEGSGTGRLRLNNLKAASRYVGTFSSDYRTLPLDFTTLEAPEGEMTGSFALIADPHLSLKTENRKGRFMVESAMLFQDVVAQCNLLKPDFVLLPGDITNNGTASVTVTGTLAAINATMLNRLASVNKKDLSVNSSARSLV